MEDGGIWRFQLSLETWDVSFFWSFLRVHRNLNRRCIYMFIVWQTKSSKLFCWNMKPYGKVFLSEHVNDTIRVWFETIINRYPHTFQWRQNSTCFIISSLECGVFHSPVFFESMMLRRYQWLYQRQVVRRVHLWGCGQTHEGCPPHTNCCGQDLICDFCSKHQRIWEMIWIWSQTVEFQDIFFL